MTQSQRSAWPCPLCGALDIPEWHRDRQREYWRCERCALVFLSPEHRLDFDAEMKRYRLHRNSNNDPGYLKFLSRLAEPMIAHVPKGALGLDYGSGPATALANLMTHSGRPTTSYDPVFQPDASALDKQYDFVTCSEVLEHVHQPLAVVRVLQRLVARRGIIGIMTQWYDAHDFGTWSYRRDPTHVCFYSERSIRWIAEHFAWQLTIPATDIAIYITE